MKMYLKLLRVKNYIKNILILAPFIFAGTFLKFDKTYAVVFAGLLAFCLASSIVYIINDILDAESDKHDEAKKNRPIASGAISIKKAIVVIGILAGLYVILNLVLHNLPVTLISLSYVILNLFYSIRLKHIPVVDIAVLSLFFVIRLYYGGFLTNTPISIYLYLTVLCFSFMMGANKRKIEIKAEQGKRAVLEKYSFEFLDMTSYVFMGLSMVFYSLWIMVVGANFKTFSFLLLSVFVLIFILIYYQYMMTLPRTNGNPVDVIFEDKILIISIIFFVICMVAHYGKSWL